MRFNDRRNLVSGNNLKGNVSKMLLESPLSFYLAISQNVCLCEGYLDSNSFEHLISGRCLHTDSDCLGCKTFTNPTRVCLLSDFSMVGR